MISQIALQPIFGMPVIAYGGLFTFGCFLFTAYIAWANMKGKTEIPFKWHMRMAFVSFVLAIVHGILGLSIFFGF
jgi:hypothetical protein